MDKKQSHVLYNTCSPRATLCHTLVALLPVDLSGHQFIPRLLGAQIGIILVYTRPELLLWRTSL